ncbi:MAG: zinc ribbon domain-containing protein [Candidatus Methanoculleus thermohydrogenotrophicum]
MDWRYSLIREEFGLLESVHHDHREQSGRGWFSRDPGESRWITSQQCSRCGMIVKKTLSDRAHSCPHCGLVSDGSRPERGDQHYEIETAISGMIS